MTHTFYDFAPEEDLPDNEEPLVQQFEDFKQEMHNKLEEIYSLTVIQSLKTTPSAGPN